MRLLKSILLLFDPAQQWKYLFFALFLVGLELVYTGYDLVFTSRGIAEYIVCLIVIPVGLLLTAIGAIAMCDLIGIHINKASINEQATIAPGAVPERGTLLQNRETEKLSPQI